MSEGQAMGSFPPLLLLWSSVAKRLTEDLAWGGVCGDNRPPNPGPLAAGWPAAGDEAEEAIGG